MILQAKNYFTKELFHCYFDEKGNLPLVVSPHFQDNSNLIDLSKQINVARAIKEFGAIVFSGFNITEENFLETVQALTGKLPKSSTDSTREEVRPHVYKSTVVADSHSIPLHQEDAADFRNNMPGTINFLCVEPPKNGAGHTLVGNARIISQKIQETMPEFWQRMQSDTLTYTARYLPTNSWRTRWIRLLNPSHATIQERFGTEDHREVEEQCVKEKLTCKWDGDWAVVTRSGIPAVISVGDESLYCNQIHLNKFSPALCGGWIKYIFARILLYLTTRTMQYDVKFDHGPEINRKDAGKLIEIFKHYQVGRDWKKGDLMMIDNATTMHGKSPHKGKRVIRVTMTG